MRAKLSYANVTATLALIVAVAGGSTAIALSVGKNSVRASSIKAGNVTARELAGVTDRVGTRRSASRRSSPGARRMNSC